MRLFQDFRYKILAVGIAGLLWVVARGTSDMERGFDIPIVFESIPNDLVIVDKSTDELNVRWRGSRAALRNVSPAAMEYHLDASGAKPGNALYEIDETQFDPPRGTRFVGRSPSSVEVKFERRGTKVVRVRPDLEGDPPEGFRVAGVEVEPDRVRISGARSQVLRLTEVITEAVALAGATQPIEREVRLIVGARNAWVEEPEAVRLRVRIEPAPVPEEAAGGKG